MEPTTWVTVAAAAATVTALVLTGFAVAAWFRERRARFVWIALAFTAVATRAVVVSVALMTGRATPDLYGWTLGLDATALLLIYVAAVR